MGAWVIGHNLAGYLPESDTWPYATWDEAWRALRDEMERYADDDDQGEDGPSMRARVDALLESDGPDYYPDGDWSACVDDNMNRPIAFWIQWSDDRSPEE